MASTGDLLGIQPLELQFPFELEKQISCSLQLSNKTDNYVAFKVKTTNPKKYCVRPNTGIVLPTTLWLQCKLERRRLPTSNAKTSFSFRSSLQLLVLSQGYISADMESRHDVEECKLRVVYVPPPCPVSPIREGSDEGSSPRASFSDNGNATASEFTAAPRSYVDSQDNSFETRALVSKLTDERNPAIQFHKQLQQELELLRKQTRNGKGIIPVVYVVLVGLTGIVLGYLMKSS